MKAKEIAKMICCEGLEENIKYYEEEIKEYARQKCKEQRGLCADAFSEIGYYPGDQQAIVNAPEPKFD